MSKYVESTYSTTPNFMSKYEGTHTGIYRDILYQTTAATGADERTGPASCLYECSRLCPDVHEAGVIDVTERVEERGLGMR